VGRQVVRATKALRGFDSGLYDVLVDLWVVVSADNPVGSTESGETMATGTPI
jgi:hypothetical protein